MVDVTSKRCAHPGCTKQPVHDFAGSVARTQVCAQHAGGVNLRRPRSRDGGRDGARRHSGSTTVVGDEDSTASPGAGSDGKGNNLSSPSAQVGPPSARNKGGRKRVREAAADERVAPSLVEAPGTEGGPISQSGDAAVKVEEGLFEGRPSGSFQSRRRRRRE